MFKAILFGFLKQVWQNASLRLFVCFAVGFVMLRRKKAQKVNLIVC